MHCFNHMLYEPEPEFSSYETYYLTSFDSSYSSAGPYGEPLQYHQEELHDESHFFPMREEGEDGFLSGYLYSNGLTNQQGYDTMESPYNDSGTWLDGYESYFVSRWGGGLLPYGYSYSDYEADGGSSEKTDNSNPDGVPYSFGHEMQSPAYNDDQWRLSHFEFAFNEDYHDQGSQKHETANDDNWNETRLWESIFGHWPCLLRLDQESQAA